ncbi:MAG: GNAT family N-acetyltransferase [Blastocatellia bacterium]
MNFKIAEYRKEDYSTLEKMILLFYEEDSFETGYENKMTDAKIRNTADRAFLYPDQVAIKLFKVSDEIAGYSILTFYWSNEYGGPVTSIDEVFVTPKHRNQGIATLFISQLAARKESVMLDLQVLKENTKALNLYRRLGFEAVDRIFMQKFV